MGKILKMPTHFEDNGAHKITHWLKLAETALPEDAGAKAASGEEQSHPEERIQRPKKKKLG